MRTFVRIIGWSLLGSGIAWAFTFAACLLYDWAFPKKESDEFRAWGQFAILMFSPWLGVVTGAIYGAVRARRRARSDLSDPREPTSLPAVPLRWPAQKSIRRG